MTHIRLGYGKTMCGLNALTVITCAEAKDATCPACKKLREQYGVQTP